MGGGGELVQAFTRKYVAEHQNHPPRAAYYTQTTGDSTGAPGSTYILESYLSSSFVDKVDIITPELVLRGFFVCLNTGETMVTSGG
jgi:hypothetical protein